MSLNAPLASTLCRIFEPESQYLAEGLVTVRFDRVTYGLFPARPQDLVGPHWSAVVASTKVPSGVPEQLLGSLFAVKKC